MSASMTENNYNYQTPPRRFGLSNNEINNINNRNRERPNNSDIYEINDFNPINLNSIFNETIYINDDINPISPINLNNIFNEININYDFIDTFNTRQFPLLLPSSNCDEDCPICLSSMDGGDIVHGNCHETHRFHRGCIEQWGRLTCPMCRGNL